MLAIARALMSRPRLLLLDEPSLGLAPLIVRQIFDAIRSSTPRTASPCSWSSRTPSRAQARPPRLCHGQRADHAVRHRPRIAGPAGSQVRLSRRRPAAGRDHDAKPFHARFSLRGGFLRRLRPRHRHSRRRGGGARRPRHRADLAAVVADRRLYADPRRRGALYPLRPVRRHAAVTPLLCGRQRGLHGVRICRFPRRAGQQMVSQYRWINEPNGRLRWRRKPS